jgi:chromate reductase
MTPLLRILGIAGSLRKASFNRALLRAAHDLAPPGVAIETFDLNGVPPYNDDLLATPPTRVTRLKEAVRAADAVLLATPEYNYSIPGVLKNAIDWGSRPIRENAWARVPVAILGASRGRLGTARAQLHLRQCLWAVDMRPLSRPEVLVTHAEEKFDADGTLTDEATRARVGALVEALAGWIHEVRDGRGA